MGLMASFWYFLPNNIYNKAETFKDKFIISFNDVAVVLENERGEMIWHWNRFSKYFESPHFFHLYFDAKSFFIVPKDNMSEEFIHELRGLLKLKIKK
jgi:hypothetical protein